MAQRKQDSYQTFLRDFIHTDIWVVCPECMRKAIVKPIESSGQGLTDELVKLICPNCGHNKRLAERPEPVLYQSRNKVITGRVLVMGQPIDPYFHLPLWLQSECEGNILWAYNLAHLAFLKSHIQADLRERNNPELFNSSLGSRLPRWMTSAKNRSGILNKIRALEEK